MAKKYNNPILKDWLTIKECYKESSRPDWCAKEIMQKIGMANAKKVFAIYCTIRNYDGRIYNINREWLSTTPVTEEEGKWETTPLLYGDLDDIHPAHINQIISHLRMIDVFIRLNGGNKK